MNRPRIVVEVNGGVVQAVYSDDPQTTVALVDWDSEDSGPTEPNLVTAKGADGREYVGFAGEFPPTRGTPCPRKPAKPWRRGPIGRFDYRPLRPVANALPTGEGATIGRMVRQRKAGRPGVVTTRPPLPSHNPV